jgi:hypothetical protein
MIEFVRAEVAARYAETDKTGHFFSVSKVVVSILNAVADTLAPNKKQKASSRGSKWSNGNMEAYTSSEAKGFGWHVFLFVAKSARVEELL